MLVSINTIIFATITSGISSGLMETLSLVAVLGWLGLLIMRLLVSVNDSGTAQRFTASLNVGILPLSIVFLVILAMNIIGALD
jgi:hypothetical protein